ncbi:MAG: hypothetical protein ACXABY_08055 [Candidatus Thorarchaeota archaeon]|jgi:hypothetical protein
MGTRSLIYFQERDSDGTIVIYVVIYQQWDGYPQGGVGERLATFLKNAVLVNGVPYPAPEMKEEKFMCNGFDDLVARFIRKHKEDKAGGFYIYPAIPNQDQDYNYYVTNTDDGIKVKVNKSPEMTIDEFYKMCT